MIEQEQHKTSPRACIKEIQAHEVVMFPRNQGKTAMVNEWIKQAEARGETVKILKRGGG